MSIVRREVGVELYRRNTVKALPRPISHNPRPITGGFQRCCQLFRHHIAKNQFLILRINIFCSFYQPWLQIPHEKRVHRAACVHATRNIFMVDSFPARSIANGIPEQDHETRHWLAEALWECRNGNVLFIGSSIVEILGGWVMFCLSICEKHTRLSSTNVFNCCWYFNNLPTPLP